MAYTKTTWVNGGAPAINASNLNKIEQGIEDAHNLITSGSNANGSWVKMPDGTMVCYRTVSVVTNINTAWGQVFLSPNIALGSFPQTFVGVPIVTAIVSSQAGASIIRIMNTTSSAIGTTNLTRGTAITAETITLSITAIGRWF